MKQTFQTVNFFLQKFRLIIVDLIFSVIRIRHSCRYFDKIFLNLLQETDSIPVAYHGFHHTDMAGQLIYGSLQLDSVIRFGNIFGMDKIGGSLVSIFCINTHMALSRSFCYQYTENKTT